MTEHPPDYQTAPDQPVDPHTAIYQQLRQGFSQNDMLYEHLSMGVLKMLPGSRPQAIEDALNMMCVSLGKTPLEALLIIHEFLSNYHSIMSREQAQPEPPTPEEASPFLGRGEP